MRRALAAVLTLLPVATSPNTALGYTGGPILAELAGYDSTATRVYFRLQAFDEYGNAPEVYYFDLDGSAPDRPIRDKSLEVAGPGPNPTWGDFAPVLQHLRCASEFDLALSVSADSVAADSAIDLPRYDLTARVSAGSSTAVLRATAVCRALVSVRGIYEIPGRSERLVVVSYCGRSEGCQDVEQPLG